MTGGEHSQAGRHRFENGIGNALLILIRRCLARVQEKMRGRIKLQQFRLGKKSAEMNFAGDAQLFRQFFQVRLQRTFAGDDQLGVGKFFLKNGESAKRRGDAFLGNQSAGLHESPAPFLRGIAADKGKFVQRHSGPIDAQTFGRATESQQPFGQRFRAREDERDRFK